MKQIESTYQSSPKSGPVAELITSHSRLWEYMGNAVLALWSLSFFIALLVDFNSRHRVSSLLMVIFDGALVWVAVTRSMPKSVNVSLYDWAISFAASWIVFLLRPAPQIHDNLLLLGIQLLGTCISLAGLFSLNNSFGVVPANRGVKTSGMYRIVRHPIYVGYLLSTGAFMIQNLTLANALVYAGLLVLTKMRVVAEERLLLVDPVYCEYARNTRWRVLPGFF
jgi:protein-S-isoprenylcysteine O-methyltransferase Ste14